LRLHDGRYECAYCRAILDIPLVEKPTVTMYARSGELNVRVLKYEGREIHRCEISPLIMRTEATDPA
jgi:hypothetical protein